MIGVDSVIHTVSFQSKDIFYKLINGHEYAPSMKYSRTCVHRSQYETLASIIHGVDIPDIGRLSTVFTIVDINRTLGGLSDILINMPAMYDSYLRYHDLNESDVYLFDLVFNEEDIFMYDVESYKQGDIVPVENLNGYSDNNVWGNTKSIQLQNVNAVYEYVTCTVIVDLVDVTTNNIVTTDFIIEDGCEELHCIYGNDYFANKPPAKRVRLNARYQFEASNWVADGLYFTNMRIV